MSPAEPAAPDADGPPLCTVCGHELARHDTISERFCRATQARALTRACICR